MNLKGQQDENSVIFYHDDKLVSRVDRQKLLKNSG